MSATDDLPQRTGTRSVGFGNDCCRGRRTTTAKGMAWSIIGDSHHGSNREHTGGVSTEKNRRRDPATSGVFCPRSTPLPCTFFDSTPRTKRALCSSVGVALHHSDDNGNTSTQDIVRCGRMVVTQYLPRLQHFHHITVECPTAVGKLLRSANSRISSSCFASTFDSWVSVQFISFSMKDVPLYL